MKPVIRGTCIIYLLWQCCIVAAEQNDDLRELSLEQLLNIPVAAAAREVKTAREAPATVYVITESMIRDRGYNYLYDALRDAPGFDIIWMGGLYGPILNQHGLDTPENNKLILMIDGIVDNNLSAGTAQIYMQYSLHNVKRIEILYGPASALYGANAMTGLIHIITKTGEDLNGVSLKGGGMIWDPQIRRSGKSGSVALGKVWGNQDRKIDASGSFHMVDTRGPDLRINSDEARSDDPNHPALSNYYFSPDYVASSEIGTYMAQGRIHLKERGVTVSGHVWQHRGGQGGYGHEGFAFLNGFQNKPDTWNFRHSTFSFKHDLSFRQNVANQFQFVFRDTRLLNDSYDAYFTIPGTGPDGAGKVGSCGVRYFRPDHSLKFDENVLWNLNSQMDLVAGFSAELQRVSDYQVSEGQSFDHQELLDPGVVPTIDDNRLYDYHDFSGYFEHTWNLTEKFALTSGVRLDVFRLNGDATPNFFGTKDHDAQGNCLPNAPDCKTEAEANRAGAVESSGVYYIYSPYSRTRTTVNPRIGAVYQLPSRNLTLKALYGEGFRMPTVRELFSVTVNRFSNPQLQSEKIRTVETSATYEIKRRGFTELDLFYTKANRIVQLSPTNVKRPGRDAFLNQFQNVSEAQIYGFDFKANIHCTPMMDVFGYYSFQIPRYTKIDPGNLSSGSSDRIPRQSTNKGMVGASLYMWNRRLVLTPRLNMMGERRSVITCPIPRVSSYASFDLSGTIRDIGSKGLYAQISAYNIGNADIIDPGFRTANKFDDFPAVEPEPGFRLFLNLGYQFGF